MVIIFSIRFRRRLKSRRSGPSALSIPRRLPMSAVLTVLVSSVAVMKAGRKMATPMTSRIQLLKLS